MNNSNTPNPNERTPVVEFEYPDSTTGKMKVRYLRVIEANGHFQYYSALE
jgi:hypothetical protein